MFEWDEKTIIMSIDIDQHNENVIAAAEEGKADELHELLKTPCDLHAVYTAVEMASGNGHFMCVGLLLPLCTLSNHSFPLQNSLKWAAQGGHLDCVKLLCGVVDPAINNSQALREAAAQGHLDCVEYLIPLSKPDSSDSGALYNAAHAGHMECVKMLLPHSDPMAGESDALFAAAREGHTEIVGLLIPLSDCKAGNSRALHRAALEGDIACVQLLLPHSDALAEDSRALAAAAKEQHWEVFNLLAPLSDMKRAQIHLTSYPYMNFWEEAVQRYQRLILSQAVGETDCMSVRSRKM